LSSIHLSDVANGHAKEIDKRAAKDNTLVAAALRNRLAERDASSRFAIARCRVEVTAFDSPGRRLADPGIVTTLHVRHDVLSFVQLNFELLRGRNRSWCW
jgi:hypothetical protein